MTTLEITQKDFHKGTIAVFEMAEIPNKTADFISPSGSEYRYTSDGVYRTSDHWGWVKSCHWTLKGDDNKGSKATGFVRFEDMQRDVVFLKNQMYAALRSFGSSSDEFKFAKSLIS